MYICRMNSMIINKNENIINKDEFYRKVFKSVIDSFRIEGLIVPEETASEIAKRVEKEFKISS